MSSFKPPPAANNNQNKNMWELCKENIQPLCHGRKMALLNNSLSLSVTGDGSFQPSGDYVINDMIESFENELKLYQGNDPLEIWVRYLAYFEQNRLCSGKFKTNYIEVLKNCVKTFINDKEWNNDKRYVDIFVNSFSELPCERRVAIFQNSLNKGVGNTVSRMYLQLAEDYESLKKYNLASEVIELGKQKRAQPIEFLEEFSLNLQVRVAEIISQQLKDKEEDFGASEIRSFGASVPLIGPTHDAQNIRVGLVAADPYKTRSALPNAPEPKKLIVYPQNENENVDNMQAHVNLRTCITATATKYVEEVELGMKDKLDKENIMEASKWSKPDNILNNPIPVSTGTGDKIQIYEDSQNSVVVPERKVRKAPRPVLHERKIELEDETEHPSKAALVIAPVNQNAVTVTNQLFMCRLKDLWQDGKELTFEHLRVAAYRKRIDDRHCSEQVLTQSRNKVSVVAALNPNMQLLPDPRLKSMEIENVALKFRVAELEQQLEQCELAAALERKNHVELENLLRSQRFTLPTIGSDRISENAVSRTLFEVNPARPANDYGNVNMAPRRTTVEQDIDETEAILKKNANVQPDFDVSNLTRALNFHPMPMHNSTPERARQDDVNRLTIKPTMAEPADLEPTVPPCYQTAKSNFNQTMHIAHNLSTIQETSKESRCSTTTSSSGSTANYTKSAQRTAARSQLASSTTLSHFQLYQDWTNKESDD